MWLICINKGNEMKVMFWKVQRNQECDISLNELKEVEKKPHYLPFHIAWFIDIWLRCSKVVETPGQLQHDPNARLKKREATGGLFAPTPPKRNPPPLQAPTWTDWWGGKNTKVLRFPQSSAKHLPAVCCSYWPLARSPLWKKILISVPPPKYIFFK